MMIDRLKSNISSWYECHLKWLREIVLFIFFMISLAFFLHFREVRIDHLELGSIAKKYVLAQVGFDFSDLETTRVLREESLRDIGLIYYFDDEDISRAESQIQDDLTKNPKWRKEFSSLTFEDLIKASNAIRDTLLSVEFTDLRTMHKLLDRGMTSHKLLPFELEKELGHSMTAVWNQVEKESFPGTITE